jgi:hypothetical protein
MNALLEAGCCSSAPAVVLCQNSTPTARWKVVGQGVVVAHWGVAAAHWREVVAHYGSSGGSLVATPDCKPAVLRSNPSISPAFSGLPVLRWAVNWDGTTLQAVL